MSSIQTTISFETPFATLRPFSRLCRKQALALSMSVTMWAISPSPISSTAGSVKPPFFVQMIFGILGGIGPDLNNLIFMEADARPIELFGEKNYRWSVLAAGRHQMPFLTQAALLGGHVRVGLEDSLFIERGRLAVSNAEQVDKIVRILAEMGLEPATPAEAREMLALKGGDRVDF